MDEENNHMDDSCCEEFACGDPKVDIRVGDEYQAEIPPMISEFERAALLVNPLASDLESDAIVVGLPVEIMWIDTKHKDGQGLRDDNVDMSESLKSLKTKRNRRGESDKNTGSKQRMNMEAVPEKSSSSWEDLEVDGFVLGLYTFGKNFTQVKKFLESKETGELLSFYYGKFYKSAKHKTWSNSLKKGSRKCIQGKKLYSGWRLQQLLSRLIPSTTDESQKTKLVNVSKSFSEGNISLEKYISDVKELVGLRSLVEAVAIGKDKEDLTVLTIEPVKSKQWFTVSSAVPAGLGVYNSLTSDEIIEKLSGGSRLSKARCNDIFWEAVWPRLLARGWHSEQPKDRGYIKSKDNIVFLIPGVKKFSRHKLVKQNHYFDSISDIIKKVVSDPELLEFETEVIRPPNGFIEENNHDQSKQEKRRYLRSPESSSTHMKFTVVDTTSLASEGKLCAFRELKNSNPESLASQSEACQGHKSSSVERSQMMPLDVKKHAMFADECKWEKRRMKKLVEEPVRFMIVDTSVDHGGQSSGIRRRRHLPGNENLCKAFGDPSSQNQSGTNTGVTWEYPKRTGSGVKESLENVQQCRSKKRSARKSESNNHHSVSSLRLPKRRRLSTCVRKDIERFGESSVSMPPALDQATNCYHKLSVDSVNIKTEQSEEAGDGFKIQEKPQIEPKGLCSISVSDNPCSSKKQETLHELSSSEKQQVESNQLSSDKKCSTKDLDGAQQQEKPIQIPSMSGLDKKKSPSTEHGTTQEVASIKQEEEEEEEEEQNQQTKTVLPRRQSTRKRPLTTRALEALESGFYIAKSMKSTSKPIKRERSTRIKHSARASNRTQGESDNGFLVTAITSIKSPDRIEYSEPSFLADKATTASKPVDQTEDSNKVTTVFPKRPPIVLKLPFKRG